MNGAKEIWIEIGALALCLGGLFFFTVAFYLLTMLVINSLLTGHAGITDPESHIAFGLPQLVVALIGLALPGVILLIGACGLRYLLETR